MEVLIFQDRIEAAEKLADRLQQLPAVRDTEPGNGIVLGIPRGGVVIARTVADRLGWPLAAIVTPTQTIRVKSPGPAPKGVDWQRLSPEELGMMPVLAQLKAALRSRS